MQSSNYFDQGEIRGGDKQAGNQEIISSRQQVKEKFNEATSNPAIKISFRLFNKSRKNQRRNKLQQKRKTTESTHKQFIEKNSKTKQLNHAAVR